GHLFGIRVKNQNTLVVNLPTAFARYREVTLTIAYAARLEPQAPERETFAPFEGAQARDDLPMLMSPEPSFLYSSRSFWYPQAAVSDYATSRIRISVPAAIDCVASGELEPGFPMLIPSKDPAQNRELLDISAAKQLRDLGHHSSRYHTRVDDIKISRVH